MDTSQIPNFWFSYRANKTLTLTANTFGSTYDTVLYVYSGTPGNLTSIGSNDDAGGTWSSSVTFAATKGSASGGLRRGTGAFALTTEEHMFS